MPDKFGLFSIKETIAEANLNGIKPIYVLIGNDAYLQTLFINQISKIHLFMSFTMRNKMTLINVIS